MILFLIRHGESFVNLKEWDKGNVDTGLTPLGEAQAQALAKWLAAEIPQPDIIYSSTMKRARETAAPVAAAYGMSIQYEDRIREIGNNQRDHRPYPNHALPDYGDFWSSERPFTPLNPLEEDSEAMIHFRARVGIFLEELIHKHDGQTIMSFCHGGVIDLSFDHIFDTGIWRRCEVWTRNTGITCLEYIDHANRESWRLHYHNRTDHFRLM